MPKNVQVHSSSVTQSCQTLCDPMDCSTPGFPVHHQLPELAQTHVHQVSDAIQPFHPLSSLSPPAFSLSQLGKTAGKECSNYHITAFILHASKVILKILQARLQQYTNQELPDVQAGFRKGRAMRNQIANIC